MLRKINRKNAFTLAEVMLTMIIIGTIATLTIAPMITSYKEKANVVKLKKFYVEINEAFKMAQAVHGKINADWTFDTIIENSGMKVAKRCGGESGCFSQDFHFMNSENIHGMDDSYNQYTLSNGINIAFRKGDGIYGTSKELAHVWAGMFIDIDGVNGANEFGKDIFAFQVTSYRIVPRGEREFTNECCTLSTCTNGNGRGCAAWVIEKGNMDYLRREVSWDE